MFRDYCVSLRGIEPGTFVHGPESGVVLENAADHLDVAEKANTYLQRFPRSSTPVIVGDSHLTRVGETPYNELIRAVQEVDIESLT